MKNLKINVFDEITLDTFCKAEKLLSDSGGDFDEILLLINSTGNDIAQAFAICDLLKATKKPINTVAIGYCESCATILFSLGQKRYIARNAYYMIHQPRIIMRNNMYYKASDINNLLTVINKDIKRWKEVLKKSSDKLDDQWLEQVFSKESDTLLSVDEVLNLGLATDILDDLSKI